MGDGKPTALRACVKAPLWLLAFSAAPLSHTASLQDNGLLRAATQHHRRSSASHVGRRKSGFVCVCVYVCVSDIEGKGELCCT